MGEVEELFDRALADESATAYRLGRALAAHYRGKPVVEGLSETFDLDEYARAGNARRGSRRSRTRRSTRIGHEPTASGRSP
jgi:hypothetical protein